jgi:hypothetical protein
MPFKKLGESIDISPANIQAAETVIPIIDAQVLADMKKFAYNLKRIAPKAEDFLYFSAVMMHAAEAALINDDGTQKLNKSGEAIEAHWDKRGGSWRWIASDPSMKPYKNSNGDIFPEEELVKAYKKWIGRPLCIDHKSSSVDHVRGFIVDTYYDRNLKRVIALCALDKFNYPDLARKISTGYSNSVSMGTAVERAICYDCGTVAKTEQDFCQHMRSRTCYGEINVGLNPIELSIVVNGADPAAKIKHIIAAANTLNNYVEQKAEELKKLGDQRYTASIILTNNENDSGVNSMKTIDVSGDSLEAFKTDIERALGQLQSLNSSMSEENNSKDTNDTAFNQSSGTIAMDETELPGTDFSLAPPVNRFVPGHLEQELAIIKASIESKLSQMQRDLNKLASTFTNTKEEIMSGKNDNMNKQGYYLGGGGVNEPTPGEKKYPVDPTQDDLREHDDKQMVGQKPFPDVGPVDGMYPGYASFPTGELERKKMLARAEIEERAIRRSAVIENAKNVLEAANKSAYFQNGQDAKNPNTPTPHQRKYPVDPTQDDLREHDDKQMVGQKPFPDVGPVDGLHPSPLSAEPKDELKRKEMLRRAGLMVKFNDVKNANGNIDYANSNWEAYNDDKLIFSKTVDEITDGRSEALFSAIRSEAFGKDLIVKIKSVGLNKASNLFKRAQVPPPAQSSAPVAMDAPQVPGDMGGPANDNGKEGDPKETAMELSEKIRDLSSDLVEAVRALTGEEAQMGEMGESSPLAAADDSKVTTAALFDMKREVLNPLILATKEAIAGLNDSEGELNSLVGLYDKGAVTKINKDFVDTLLDSAIVEAKEALADSFKLLGAFAKFARGSTAIDKRAEQEMFSKQANGAHMEPGNKEIMGMLGDSGGALVESAPASDGAAEDLLNAMLADDLATVAADDTNEAIMTEDPAAAAQIAKENPGVDVEVKKAAMETKAGRQALRAKLAAEMKWNPVFREFHPKDKAMPGPLDTKPSDGLEIVENLEEKHDRMMDVATSPPNVRKEAAEIQKLISEGKLKAQDLDLLVANGVDPAAVKYWKDFYGEVGAEGKEFATELVKEHAKAQMEEEVALYKVKIARAYELAYEMVDRELLPRNKDAVTSQVSEIMTWNDQGFESMKKVIARQSPVLQKAASGRMPQVGLFGSEDSVSSNNKSDRELLIEAFATSKSKRMF